MSWESVEAAIRWVPDASWGTLTNSAGALSLPERETILNYLRQLHTGSAQARDILEDWVYLGHEIRLYKTQTSAGLARPPTSAGPSGVAGFNLSVANDAYQINDFGYMVKVRPELLIIHELSHALTGTRDLIGAGGPGFPVVPSDFNNPTFDHFGGATLHEIKVAEEMGWTDSLRSSFMALFLSYGPTSPYTSLRSDISYTEGNVVDLTYMGDRFPQLNDTFDASARLVLQTRPNDQVRELVFGLDGDDILKTGAGNDYVYGGSGNDTILLGSGSDFAHGGSRAIEGWISVSNDGLDTADYSTGDGGYALSSGIVVNIDSTAPTSLVDGKKPIVVADDGYGNMDRLVSIEKIKGSTHADWVEIKSPDLSAYALTERTLEIDGGGAPSESGDLLNFSGAAMGAYIGSALAITGGGIEYRAEAYMKYEAIVFEYSKIGNLHFPTGVATGRGFVDPTGLVFTNFEKVVGSSGSDRFDLWGLNPGGALSSAQEAALLSAQRKPIRGDGDPQTAQNDNNERLADAAEIDQNKVNVSIHGGAGAGADYIQGTRTGINKIEGGDGTDRLYAGGFRSTIYGGKGTDLIVGGGFESTLYGGDGSGPDNTADIFDLSNNSWVMDANTLDHILWGPYHLTGGVQQWWMDGQWAYHTQFSSLLSGTSSLGFLNVFGALAVVLDQGTMTTARYTIADGKHLVIQVADGRGGQAVIENYTLDPETAKAAGNVVVFKQVMGQGTFASIVNYIKLAIAAGFGGTVSGTDPLVLDLDGDGLELVRPDAANVYFDIDQDGFAERTAWVSGDDGLLARDLNGNSNIDDIGELFGNAATDGFTVLATLDSNADGKISAADSGFGTLRIWRDLDGDGVVDTGELITLADAGITEISLATSTPEIGSIRGNTIRAEATFTRADGTTSKIGDVLLENVQVDSRYLGDATVSPAAAALPNLKGFGNVTDLAVAMTDDAALLSEVASFKDLPATTNWAALKSSAESILLNWAGVDGVTATPMANGAFDTRKLAFLEAYFGQQLAPRDGAGHPIETNVAELIASWQGVLDKAAIRLAAQGPLEAIFGGLSYDLAQDRFVSPDAATLGDIYAAAIAQLSSNPATALVQWNTDLGPELAAFAEALLRPNGKAIRADFAVQSLVRALDTTASPLDLAQLVSGLGLSGVQIGTAGNDTLARTAEAGLQVYVGGAGNDSFTGGNGQDVYVFGTGFGQDTIYDSDPAVNGDRIRLALLNPDDVTIKRVGNDLVIEVNGTTDRITVQHQYDAPTVMLSGLPLSADHAIEEIQFADGTIYEPTDIAAAIGLGTSGNDTIDGTAFAEVIGDRPRFPTSPCYNRAHESFAREARGCRVMPASPWPRCRSTSSSAATTAAPASLPAMTRRATLRI